MKSPPIIILCCFLTWVASLGAQKPNFVLIMADDLGWGDLSCYGQAHFQTPELDRLAAEGVRFTAHYAGSTVCAPSRAALLTGRDTGHGYLRGNGQGEFSLPSADVMPNLVSILKKNGYRTAMIGKSSTACDTYNRFQPLEFGFDFHFGYLTHREAHRHFPEYLWRNGEREYYGKNQGIRGEQYAEDLFLEEAIHWIQENRDGPFFLFLSLAIPHADLSAPDEAVAPFRDAFEETPFPDGQHYAACPQPKATVAGMVTHMDRQVGELVRLLQEEGLDRSTILLFTSDNGPHFEGGHSPEALDSNGPWRGGKRDLYEGGIRVPLIVWGPGHVRQGLASSHLTAFWDYMPTMLDAADIEWPADLTTEGVSFLPVLSGREVPDNRDFLYWEFHERGGKQAVRMGNWKAVRLNAQANPNGPVELYNLETDPGETRDLAGKFPEMAETLSQLMNTRTPSWNPLWNFPLPKQQK